jgi:hypothetical protein
MVARVPFGVMYIKLVCVLGIDAPCFPVFRVVLLYVLLVMLLSVALHWRVSEFCLRCCMYCTYCQNVHHPTLSSHCLCDFYIVHGSLDLGNFRG